MLSDRQKITLKDYQTKIHTITDKMFLYVFCER